MTFSRVVKVLFLLVLHALIVASYGGESLRIKRGAAYAGGYGGANGAVWLSSSAALGQYGGFTRQTHPAPSTGKFTVQQALGTYGGFQQNSHQDQGPTIIGSEGGVFNKG